MPVVGASNPAAILSRVVFPALGGDQTRHMPGGDRKRAAGQRPTIAGTAVVRKEARPGTPGRTGGMVLGSVTI